MSNRKTLYLGSALALALCLAPLTSALAGPGAGGKRGPGMRGPGHHGLALGAIARQLDLSEEQREGIREVFERYRADIAAQLEATMPARAALREAIQGDGFDEGAIRSASAEVAAHEAETAVLRGRIFQDAFALLTDEQQAEARALLEERPTRRGPRGFGRRGFGNGAGGEGAGAP